MHPGIPKERERKKEARVTNNSPRLCKRPRRRETKVSDTHIIFPERTKKSPHEDITCSTTNDKQQSSHDVEKRKRTPPMQMTRPSSPPFESRSQSLYPNAVLFSLATPAFRTCPTQTHLSPAHLLFSGKKNRGIHPPCSHLKPANVAPFSSRYSRMRTCKCRVPCFPSTRRIQTPESCGR